MCIKNRVMGLRGWGSPSSANSPDPESGAAAVFTGRQRLGLLVSFAALLMLRLPLAWLHGRFQDEEARIFMAFAWHRPASAALWRSFAGYLNLGANLSTLAMVKLVRGGLLPLELAPRFTMAVATLFQILPAVLVLTGRGRWLANRWAVVACLLIIGMSPMTEEVFANVLHIQFHLALACALILALDIPISRAARVACWLPLLLAPLCGPGAIVLAPIFAARTLLDRDPSRLMQTLALIAGSAVQMLLFYTRIPLRGQFMDPVTLANVMFLRLAVVAYLSRPGAEFLGKRYYGLFQNGGIPWWSVTALSIAYFGWLMFTALRGGRDAAFWLILSGLTIAGVALGAGMLLCDPSQWFSVGAGERYNFLPLVLIGMGLVAAMRRGDARHYRMCFMLSMLMLISGLVSFARPIEPLRKGPDWFGEVALWRRNHDYQPSVWPKGWRADLSDHDRPCSRPVPNSPVSGDPTYCESSWMAQQIRDSRTSAWPDVKPNPR